MAIFHFNKTIWTIPRIFQKNLQFLRFCDNHPFNPLISVTNTCPAAEKNPQCTNVTNKGSIQNSWTCRDCHRVRVYFNKRDYAPALNKFDNRDSLYVKLSVRVQFDKWAHPAMRPVYIGGNEYRVPFSAMKDFTDGNVDFTAEFRPLGTIEPKILSVRTCPCSHQIEPDFCDCWCNQNFYTIIILFLSTKYQVDLFWNANILLWKCVGGK